MRSMARVKDKTVKVHPQTAMLLAALKVYGRRNCEVVITSANDGQHMDGSLHYKDYALDLRIWNLGEDYNTIAESVVTELEIELGDDYDVILESNHIHMEYDPA